MRLPLLAIVLGALVLAAGCGSENRALIPQDQADQLLALVDDAGSAAASGDCDAARDHVQEAQLELNGLPRRTDQALKQNIADWLDHLDGEIEQNCGEEPEETVTPEPTETATPAPTETATPTPTPDPDPDAHPDPDRHAGADHDPGPGDGRRARARATGRVGRCWCGGRMTAPTLFADRYLFEHRLGSGGMATVELAMDTRLERHVAVKLLAEHLAADTNFVNRFRREALAAGKLVHPNIVQVFDTGKDQATGRQFIVMEWVDGPSCAEILKELGRLEPPEAVEILRQACRGLDFAHRNGVVHRDVKPGNLLRARESGQVKLADFGIAKAAEQSDITKVGSVLGTAAYLSPEQARGEPAGPRSDLYALGVVAYQLLAGRLPYEAASLTDLARQQDAAAPVALHDLDKAIPAAVSAVVERALERDPERRFPDAAAMDRALGEALRGVAPAAPPADETEATRMLEQTALTTPLARTTRASRTPGRPAAPAARADRGAARAAAAPGAGPRGRRRPAPHASGRRRAGVPRRARARAPGRPGGRRLRAHHAGLGEAGPAQRGRPGRDRALRAAARGPHPREHALARLHHAVLDEPEVDVRAGAGAVRDRHRHVVRRVGAVARGVDAVDARRPGRRMGHEVAGLAQLAAERGGELGPRAHRHEEEQRVATERLAALELDRGQPAVVVGEAGRSARAPPARRARRGGPRRRRRRPARRP